MYTSTLVSINSCSGPDWVGLDDWMRRNVWSGVCQSVVLIDTTIHFQNRIRECNFFGFV